MQNKEMFAKARQFLNEFKGDRYVFGTGCISRIGELVSKEGKKAALVIDGAGKPWGDRALKDISESLAKANIEISGEPVPAALPNAPLEDVMRISSALAVRNPDVVVCAGGGSAIDSVKSAVAYMALHDRYPEFGTFFGTGLISKMLADTGRKLVPMVAVQTASSSGAHLTKYSNITNTGTWQKKLIIDEAIVPARALYDYSYSLNMPAGFTSDGALDGVSHALEVYFGASAVTFEKLGPVCTLAVNLIVNNLERVIADPSDLEGREALGLGTDLGGYAIMIGGTNGAHLNSFSFVDILSHGRACALMNPYYTVFFAPAIERQLRDFADVFHGAGYLSSLPGENAPARAWGIAVAGAMIALSKKIGFPVKLADVNGFTNAHIAKALNAAKDPQLDSKLKNMPVPLIAGNVDEYMGSVLKAAYAGDLSIVKEYR